MKKLLAAMIALAVLAGPAFAQNKRQTPDNPLKVDELQKKKDAEKIDQQYREIISRTAGQGDAVRVDPWQNMRQVDGAQPKP